MESMAKFNAFLDQLKQDLFGIDDPIINHMNDEIGENLSVITNHNDIGIGSGSKHDSDLNGSSRDSDLNGSSPTINYSAIGPTWSG